MTFHGLLGDNAVLQCEKPLRIRGTATAGTRVSVAFAGHEGDATAAQDGAWEILLPALPPGGPYDLTASDERETLRRTGLVIGEVWLCSGQSNMAWTLGTVPQLDADDAATDDPLLRCFTLPQLPADEPASHFAGSWQLATPAAIRDFSAVAFFFARRLRAATGRPVGLIVSAVGGTMIASWLPRYTLAARPAYAPFLDRLDAYAAGNDGDRPKFAPHDFIPRTALADGWEAAGLDDRDWTPLNVPGYWQDQAWKLNGAVWYRHRATLPPSWIGHDVILELGACDDFDETFVNGTPVGSVGPKTINAYAVQRRYRIPSTLVASGRVVIAVRVFDNWGNGGLTGRRCLRRVDTPEETLALDGPWKAKVELALPHRAPTGGMPATVLYNSMIHPLVGSGLRGVLWYQGEADVTRAALYRTLLPDLIATWRALWHDALLPFGIVQLASYESRSETPVESARAELRDAQLLAARTIRHTGLAVTTDVGDAGDIHPRQKKPVGERLARWALATIYGENFDEPARSPVAADHWIENSAICIRFVDAGGSLSQAGGGPLQGFQIAGSDRVWHWANASIAQRDIVRVSSAAVPAPMAVRYAWQGDPAATLENSAGLPASPFRTDDWPLSTQGANTP
jgi:sialate O-acetylesterase